MEMNDHNFFIVRSGPPRDDLVKAFADVIAGKEATSVEFVIASIDGVSMEMHDIRIVGLRCEYPGTPRTHGGAKYITVSGQCKVALDSTKPPEERSFEMYYDTDERKGNIMFVT